MNTLPAISESEQFSPPALAGENCVFPTSPPQAFEERPLLDNIQISMHLSDELKTQSIRLRNCGKGFHIFICNCNILKVKKRCNYRVCEFCGKIRSYKFYDKYIEIIKVKPIPHYFNGRGLKFLTLTIVNQSDMIKAIDELFESITRFKRDKYVKEHIYGGLGCIEVKVGNDGLWNVHAHFIIDSRYLDMRSHNKTGQDTKLVEVWKRCSKGSYIVDIRPVKGREGALRYVLKYLTKGIIDLTDKQKAEFFEKTFGRRLLFTFGDFYDIPKITKEKRVCKDCGGRYMYIYEGSEEYDMIFGVGRYKREPPPKDLNDFIG
ncbi:MAG: protein rep [Nanoarchaeota archaeon]